MKNLVQVHVYRTNTSIILMVGESSYREEDTRWMNDPDVGDTAETLGNIDMYDEKFIFPLYQEDEARRKYVELTLKYNIL